LDLIKVEVPGWVLAKRYGEDVLKVLEPIDKGWAKEADQRKAENRAKRAKQSAENKLRREDNACAAHRRASDKRKAAEQASALQPPQLSSVLIMTSALMSQLSQLYVPNAAYPSYYPYAHYGVHPYYPHSHSSTVLGPGAGLSQSPSYIPGTYPYYMHPLPSGSFTRLPSS